MTDTAPPKRKAESDARGNGDSKRSKVRSPCDAQKLHPSSVLCRTPFWNIYRTAVKKDADGHEGQKKVGNAETGQC